MPTTSSINPTDIARTYWRYAIPTLVAMLVSGLYQIVDGIFIGHVVGSDGLAAINMVWPWVGVMSGLGLMIGAGTGALCSIAQGKRDEFSAQQSLWQGLRLLVVFGVLLSAIIFLGRDAILVLQGSDGVILDQGRAFLTVLGWTAPMVLASIALPILVRNLGAPRLATGMMLVGALTNIALDYVFIVRWNWGLQGAAIATVTGESLSALIGVIFLFSRHSTARLLPFNSLAAVWQKRLSIAILNNGLSSLLMYVYASFAVIVHNTALMHYGTTVSVAAYAISGYIMTIYYYIAEGLAAGMQPIVSYFYGAHERTAIKQVFRLASWWVIGSGIVFVLLVFLFPQMVSSVFINDHDPALQAAAVFTLRVHLFALFLDGFLVLVSAYYQSIGMGKQATIITLANMCVQLPFLFALAPWLGVIGILLALPASTTVLAIGVAWQLKGHFRQFSMLK